MAVVGIDFGSLASKIGVARHRGIDIITNEVSSRATPSLVAFGPKQRSIGEAAKTQETTNLKNTVGCLKRLVGRTLNDPDIQQYEKKFINATLVDVGGTVGADLNYLGSRQQFSATQLVAMYLGKLRDIASNELKTGVCDVVISVPGWFTDIQRRAVLDAAAIANLNTLRLINDTTAVALGYGITKPDLPELANPRHVVFVDMGHSNFSVVIVAFSKGQLSVKSTAYDRHLGGRDIDYALVQHFAEEFKSKYRIDVLSNPKATLRLSVACEKLKKVLSANIEAPLNVESIMNDVDASSKLHRDNFEALIAHVVNRIPHAIQEAITNSGLTLDQIDSIELVGGSTRVPVVRARIQSAFPGKSLSTTLNQDEAVARGATFSCAMLSPTFRVREFHVHDINHYSIKAHWEQNPAEPSEDTELILFPRGNGIPSTKVLTFYRKEPFDVEASYHELGALPGSVNPWIARLTAKAVTLDGKDVTDASIVKVKTRLNAHGVLSFESAYVEEIEEREEQPMEVDGEAAQAPKKKKITRKRELPFVTSSPSYDSTTLERLKEKEAQMHAGDKLVMDTEDRKNALEEYVYDMRGKLDDRYASYVQPEEKEKLLAALQEAEDWLYTEEGEDATKSAYVARLDALKALGDPIVIRYREAEERPAAIAQLRETLNDYMAKATFGDEKYSHIDEKDKQSIVEKAVTIQQWLDDQVARQAERPKHVDPVLRVADIAKKRDEIIYFATPILSKPKLKPVVPSNTGTPNGTNTPRTDTPDPSASTKTEGSKPEGTAPDRAKPDDAKPNDKPDGSKSTRPSEMDVD